MAIANTGIFDGGKSSVDCRAYLTPIEWWNQPPTFPFHPGSQYWWYVFSVSADGSGFWTVGDIDSTTLSGATDELRYDLWAIPPRAAARFDVEVVFNYDVDDGSIEIDFASTPSHSIGCLLQLELLTAPVAPVAGFSPA